MSDDVTRAEAAIWREKYGRERKKSRILMVATAVCAAAAVGLGVWGFSQSTSEPSPQPGLPGQMMPGGTPPAGGQMPDLAGQLFEDDGSVNTEALEQFLSRQPSGSIDQFLEFAQQNGQLTSEQADALKAAAQELQQS